MGAWLPIGVREVGTEVTALSIGSLGCWNCDSWPRTEREQKQTMTVTVTWVQVCIGTNYPKRVILVYP